MPRVPSLDRLDRATAALDPPCAVVDLDAFDANAAALAAAAAGKPLRVASKSVRCRALLRRVLARPGWQGVLAYTLAEAMWLVRTGVSDDVVVGYPTADRRAMAALAQDPAALAAVAARPGFALAGVMAYEAQVAGVPDAGAAPRAAVVRLMQRRSQRELLARRAAAVAAVVRRGGPLRFVNGGGTGSVARTTADPAVTEVTAGSGLYGPALFDGYRDWQPAPAALFALPVVRRPAPGVVTVSGGGWIASGPPGRSRVPVPWLPAGLRLLGTEGAGEVQTPLAGKAAQRLAPGDRVWFRHAKAGELCEHVDTLHLLAGDELVEAVPTYRGEGCAFL